VHLLRRMVQPNWVVFDIGAHIGYFALLLSRMVGPGGKVVAFEPSPDIFRILEENVRMNDCRNVVLENRAVAATTGVMTLRLNDADPLTSTASLVQGKATAEVQTVTADEYASGFGKQIYLVMMDVEGAEEAVLQGMRSISSGASGTQRHGLCFSICRYPGSPGSCSRGASSRPDRWRENRTLNRPPASVDCDGIFRRP
jgi:FkbM family methyltransferase